jgi:hypothetical protein
LTAVAAVTAALVLVHYWALFLVAATVAGLAWRAARRRDAAAARALGAVGVGGLALVPWLGVLRYQLEHTGTPWAKGTQPLSALTATVAAWGGGLGVLARVLGVVLVGLAAWGVLRRPQTRTVGAVTAGALLLGLAVGTVSRSAFQPRYSAVVVTLVVLLAAVGLTRVPDARVATALLVVVVVGGLLAGVRWVRVDRTQAGEAAAAIEAELGPDDVVAYCPDQLGPGVSRELPGDVAQEPYPLGDDPRFVDWVDYEDRNEAADPEAFAADLLRTADEAGGRIWYVWTPGYRTLGTACESMVEILKASGRVATTVVDRRADVDEDAEVIRYDPAG